MKTIIISDLHNRVDWVEPALSSLQYDKVIFLGDYFDDFYDNLDDIKKVAKWLKQSLPKPDRIHLCGTHDMWYRFPNNPYLQASGNTMQKLNVINQILTDDDWNLLRLYYYEQGFLLTHAGVHSFLFGNNNLSIQEMLNLIKSETEKALQDVKNGKINPCLDAGFARRGGQVVGGITWLDWHDEFEPVPHLNQIVGHTELKKPEKKITENSENYCLDTKNKHIGILKNGIFTFVGSRGKNRPVPSSWG
ncbi:MAG: metallophosphoesterase [Candidatus Ratteibacteria bacterium]|nr:metallophosphoesterase [Candidatus Ratteibacteria bacterium]